MTQQVQKNWSNALKQGLVVFGFGCLGLLIGHAIHGEEGGTKPQASQPMVSSSPSANSVSADNKRVDALLDESKVLAKAIRLSLNTYKDQQSRLWAANTNAIQKNSEDVSSGKITEAEYQRLVIEQNAAFTKARAANKQWLIDSTTANSERLEAVKLALVKEQDRLKRTAK
jgi:hypothetical protein